MSMDFTEVMEKIGKIFVHGLSLRIKKQIGIDGAPYARPKASTLAARGIKTTKYNIFRGKKKAPLRKGTPSVMSEDRLYVSHQLADEGFESEADRTSVQVFVSEKLHRTVGNQKPVSMVDIVKYNSKNQPELNPNVGASAPLVFPTTEEEIMLMTNEMEQADALFQMAADQKVEEATQLHLEVTLGMN